MAKYIERDALIAEIEKNIKTYWSGTGGGYYLAEDAIESVKTMPNAIKFVFEMSAVPAPRHRRNIGVGHCKFAGINLDHMETGFCSYGESKSDA